MIQVAVAVLVLTVFELVAWRYGADSRDGGDWSAAPSARGSSGR